MGKSATLDVERLLNSVNLLFNAHTSAVKQREVSECTRIAAALNNFFGCV
jgi:hypothetical protein